jgi:hypothetical protein
LQLLTEQGFAIVHNCFAQIRAPADSLGGEIELESKPGDTRFIVHLPSRSKTKDFEVTSALPNLQTQSFASPRDRDAGLSFTSICDLPVFSSATEETRVGWSAATNFDFPRGTR